MPSTLSETKMCPQTMQQDYSEIRQEDWVQGLLKKLSSEEQLVVLDAFKSLKRFALKRHLST